MNKNAITISSLLALCLLANATFAATLSVFPASIDISINDPLTITIEGGGFTESVDGIGLTFSWDPSILNYTGITLADPPWDTTYINDTNATNGIIDTIFTGSSNGAGTDFQLAQIDFTPVSPGSSPLLIGTSGGGCVPGACGVFANEGELMTDIIQSQVNVAPTNVVPIPAAAWLFGSGLLGLIGFFRKTTKQ